MHLQEGSGNFSINACLSLWSVVAQVLFQLKVHINQENTEYSVMFGMKMASSIRKLIDEIVTEFTLK